MALPTFDLQDLLKGMSLGGSSSNGETFDYFFLVIVFTMAVYLWETYLDIRQHRNLCIEEKPKELVFVNQEDFTKSQAYNQDKSRFGFISSLYSLVLSFVYIVLFPCMWRQSGYALTYSTGLNQHENEILHSCIFMAYFALISTIVGIPTSVYSTFVIEAKHGFNKTTPQLYVKDKIMGFGLVLLFGCPILAVVIYVIRIGGEFFYFYTWACMFVISMAMTWIFPTFIQPCFNDVKALEEGKLRSAIEKLATSVDFPLTKLFVIDGSKRSGHSNAYFYGLCNNKRIVLYDTLIEQSSQEEVVAVLGHELGHWKMGHTIKNLVIGQVHSFITFYIFGMFMHSAALFASFGFDGVQAVDSSFVGDADMDVELNTKPIVIGLVLFSLVSAPVDHVLGFLLKVFSRYNEFQADEFAVKLGYGDALKSGLISLQEKNKSAFYPDWVYSTYHHSHPPLVQRLAAIDDRIKEHTAKSE